MAITYTDADIDKLDAAQAQTAAPVTQTTPSSTSAPIQTPPKKVYTDADIDVLDKTPMLGNPLTGVNKAADQYVSSVINQMPNNPAGTALHTLAQTVAYPFNALFQAAGAAFPAWAQAVGNVVKRASGSTAPVNYAPYGVPLSQVSPSYQGLQPGRNLAQQYPKSSQAAQDIVNIGSNLIGMKETPGMAGLSSDLAGAGTKLVGRGVEATGNAVTNIGKKAYMQEVGLLKPLANKIAPSFAEAKARVGDIINNYQLDDPKGFNASVDKADNLFNAKWQKADDLISSYTQDHPDASTTFESVVDNVKKDIPKEIRAGERAPAEGVVDNIKSELETQMTAENIDPNNLSPQDLVWIKRNIGAKYKNYNPSAEPVKEAMYDNFQSGVIKQINGYVPEAGKLNMEARDIKFAKDAIEEAAGRNNKLRNWMILGTEAATLLPTAVNHPSLIPELIAAGLIPPIALSGKAASVGMNAGRAISSLGRGVQDAPEAIGNAYNQGYNALTNAVADMGPKSPRVVGSEPITLNNITQDGVYPVTGGVPLGQRILNKVGVQIESRPFRGPQVAMPTTGATAAILNDLKVRGMSIASGQKLANEIGAGFNKIDATTPDHPVYEFYNKENGETFQANDLKTATWALKNIQKKD
jgi:hypothetical protein